MIAKFSGTCSRCDGYIQKNRSKIERTSEGWVHERCALPSDTKERDTYPGHTRPRDRERNR